MNCGRFKYSFILFFWYFRYGFAEPIRRAWVGPFTSLATNVSTYFGHNWPLSTCYLGKTVVVFRFSLKKMQFTTKRFCEILKFFNTPLRVMSENVLLCSFIFFAPTIKPSADKKMENWKFHKICFKS